MTLKKITNSAVIVSALLLVSGSASAHVWQIGWKALGDGSVDFFGVSWHGGSAPLGAGSVDDFTANPAGFVLNGNNVTFDIGSVTNLNDCNGLAGTSGTCSPVWNALGLDNALASSLDQSGDTFGKYAVVNLDPAELAAVGITAGNNAVTMTTFAPNATWAPRPFDSATVPVNVVVQPPAPVPAPATLVLIGIGLFGFWISKRGV